MKPYKIIIFILAAGALIWGGLQYGRKVEGDGRRATQNEADQIQARQKAIMDKFKIEDMQPGTGETAKEGDTVQVHYAGKLDSGEEFDSSYKAKQPLQFRLGSHEVIAGFEEGILGMKPGGKRRITIPPELGYGNRRVGPIPANSTLHFTVELVAIMRLNPVNDTSTAK